MKGLGIVVMVMVFLLSLSSTPSWSASVNTTATVQVTIPSWCVVDMGCDANSTTRAGKGATIIFDKRDDKDGLEATDNPSPGYMYAPYRSEKKKNWHLVQIIANGSSVTLTASVNGTAGNVALKDVLKVWCGGFFKGGSLGTGTGPEKLPVASTSTDDLTKDWEKLDGFKRTLNQPFIGTVPFNYQLDISDIKGAGAGYSGNVTYTITTTD